MDEKIYQRQLRKGELADAMGGGGKGGGVPKFTKGELQQIFTLDVETACETAEILRESSLGPHWDNDLGALDDAALSSAVSSTQMVTFVRADRPRDSRSSAATALLAAEWGGCSSSSDDEEDEGLADVLGDEEDDDDDEVKVGVVEEEQEEQKEENKRAARKRKRVVFSDVVTSDDDDSSGHHDGDDSDTQGGHHCFSSSAMDPNTPTNTASAAPASDWATKSDSDGGVGDLETGFGSDGELL